MVKILVQWMHSADVICVPENIAENIFEYQEDFLRYVDGVSYDKKLSGTVFGIVNFIDYLNQNMLSDSNEKAYIQCEDYTPNSIHQKKEIKRMKKIYF